MMPLSSPPCLRRAAFIFLGIVGILATTAAWLARGQNSEQLLLNLSLLVLSALAAIWLWRQPSSAATTTPAPAETDLDLIFGDLQEIINALPVAVYCYVLEKDERPNLVYISKRISQLWGISAREAMADPRQLFAMIDPEDLPGFIAADRHARAIQGIFSHDLRVNLPSGEVRWLHLQSVPRRLSQGRVAYNGFIEDITQRKNVEAELLKYQTQLEALAEQRSADLNRLFSTLPDLYLRLEENGTIVDYRAGSGSDLHWSPTSFIGKRMPDLLPESEALGLRDAIDEVIRSHSVQCIEYRQPLPAGEQYYEARLLPADDGHLAVIVRNISSHKKLEASRDASLRDAERLAQIKSDFLANMSHEIRAPLNGIVALSQVAYRDNANRQVRDTFSQILESSNLLLGIINDILDFSKIEAGMLQIESLPVAPGHLASQTLELLQARAQAKHLKLSLELSDNLPLACLSDPLRIEQILLNLLSNAIKFTDAGEISLNVRREADQLVFAVRDTGIGMNPQQLGRIFNPFEQGESASIQRFGGHGLGLTITHRIVTMMDGTIEVESQMGTGSLFEVRLPYLPTEVFTTSASASSPTHPHGMATLDSEPRLAGISVLIVEDDPAHEDALFAECATMVTVRTGKEAIARIEKEGSSAFDIILMDIRMPEMDGFEATRRILKLAPKLPIVGQIARPKADERKKCLSSGMVGYLDKPIAAETLIEAIIEHARKRNH